MLKRIEGLFAELSATIYGLPLVLWRVGRSPTRGTLRLHVRHRRERDAQIGPHAAVLLAALLVPLWVGRIPLREVLRRYAVSLLAGDPGGLTEPIAAAVILTALIDGASRLYARIRHPRDPRRRARAVTMLLYAAAFATVAIGPLFWLALVVRSAIGRIGLQRGAIAVMLFLATLYVAALIAGWPLIAVYGAQRRKPTKDRQAEAMIPFAILGVFLAVPALVSGLVRWIQTPPVRLSAPYTTCVLDKAAVAVVAILRNHTRDVLVVDSQNVAVRITQRARDAQARGVDAPGHMAELPLEVTRCSLAMSGGFIVIPPGALGVVEATANPGSPTRRGNDLADLTDPERCELARMNPKPLWLGERFEEIFVLLPIPIRGSFRRWPDPSQDAFDGSGAVDDRRNRR